MQSLIFSYLRRRGATDTESVAHSARNRQLPSVQSVAPVRDDMWRKCGCWTLPRWRISVYPWAVCTVKTTHRSPITREELFATGEPLPASKWALGTVLRGSDKILPHAPLVASGRRTTLSAVSRRARGAGVGGAHSPS